MRLLSITLRNYRLHRELTVAFDPARTLIGGPNESGKSTLVEAIHRALFLRAKGTGEPHQVMRPISGSHPEVELVFEAAGQRYRLHKRFSGQSGTTSLTRAGAAPLAGDAAESELAKILGVADDVAAKAACGHWAHLWAWQGESGRDPAEHANAQRDSLIHRLSQTGGADAAMQSRTDARVAAVFAEAVEATFKQGDKPKAGSDLARAEEIHAAAERAHAEVAARLEQLHQALREHAAATQTLAGLEGELAKHQQEHEATEAKVIRVAELRRLESARSAEAAAAGLAFTTLQQASERIADLRRKILRLRAELAPQAEITGRWRTAVEEVRVQAASRLKACDAALDAVRRVRRQHELAAGWVVRFEKQQRLIELEPRAAQARETAARLATLTAELAKLPAIEPAQLKRAEKLETARVTAEAALHGMAAGVEVVATDQPVRLGSRAIPPGHTEIVTEDTEVSIGANIRLRIRPGGGTSLAEARAAAQDAREQAQKLLDTLGMPTIAAAADTSRHRSELTVRIKSETTRLTDLDAAAIEQKLQLAKADYLAAEALLGRRKDALGAEGSEAAAPADVAAARAGESVSAERLRAAEAAEQRARAERDAAATMLEAAATKLAAHVTAVERQARELNDGEAQIRMLAEQYGADADRAAKMEEASSRKARADSALATTQGAITAEQPDLLPATQARLRRMLDEIHRRRQEADRGKFGAEAQLREGGSTDPEAELALATATLAAARERRASIRRRADAQRLLARLFREEQQSLADQFTRPLVNTVSVYLQALFGAGARADVTLEDNTFSQLRISRPGVADGTAVRFDQLSGGTKEQVAIAVRLAMAEILAANHDGSLPIVLDDAFANADPERVQQLQRMLDAAAVRGLQVIVVTCTPSDYATLGAHTITLTAPQAAALAVASPSPSAMQEAAAARKLAAMAAEVAAGQARAEPGSATKALAS
ncbi:MAG: AAA family ATPase [Opitutaceae bacterium]|nr:AAA family ATPase [Opitutaceae bacterium]